MNKWQGKEATLEQILCARDQRVERQRQLLRRFGQPMISFTMNIPGPVKDSPLIRFAFRAALERLENELGAPLYRWCQYECTGCEALLVYERPAADLKAYCVSMEEDGGIGRLYDLDVLDEWGEKLSRDEGRTCLICGGPVSVCSRSRAHGLEALETRTRELLCAFAADHLAYLAQKALLDEVAFTPKPGLVDQCNTGAHRDMDLPMFRRSAEALLPHFRRFAALGLARGTAEELRQLGRQAEEAMFSATGGVNTHKGAIYSLALLLYAAGELLVSGGTLLLTAANAAAKLSPPEGTHGSAVRKRYGVGGVREEAVAGFPVLRRCYETLQQEGELAALLRSMTLLSDSTLYHRGGAEGAAFVRAGAEKILVAPAAERVALAQEMDAALIRRNLSPGGSADVLALSLFLQTMLPLMEPESL